MSKVWPTDMDIAVLVDRLTRPVPPARGKRRRKVKVIEDEQGGSADVEPQ